MFLFGCIFCRESLIDISRKREDIESKNVRIVLVHMSDVDTAHQYFKTYNLESIDSVSDPECKYYKAFGLIKGSFKQLFGLKIWMRGLEAGMKGIKSGKMLGDGFQMPGVFILQDGEVKDKFVHKFASDRPDYVKLVRCCT